MTPRPATIEMLRRLVAFDTTSRDSNLALIRHLPDEAPEAMIREVRAFAERELVPAMRAVHADTGFRWEELSLFPGAETDEGAEIVSLAKRATGRNAAGKVAFGCEAGLYDAAGIPTVICGPGHIDQAHEPDEFVALAQLAECEAFLRRVAAAAAGTAMGGAGL